MSGRILVLDDEESFAEMLSDLLSNQRFQVEITTRPKVALEILRQKHFDLLVSDYKMPLMDGGDFLERARQIYPDLPVILISGHMRIADLVKVANFGVTLVLEKPFKSEILFEYVRRFVTPVPEGSEVQRTGVLSETVKPETFGHDGSLQHPIKSYPDDLKFLPGASPRAREFLEKLFKAAKPNKHVFLAVPPGSEFDLVAREVSNWMGCCQKPAYNLTISQVMSSRAGELVKQIAEDPDASSVVTIDPVDVAISDLEALLEKFIRATREIDIEGRGLVYLYRISGNIHNGSIGRGAESQGKTPLIEPVISMPPLRERLADLAVYAKRQLPVFAHLENRPGKEVLSPDGIAFLLRYDWPGNYNELVDTLRGAVVLGHGCITTAKELQTVVECNRQGQSWLQRGSALSAFLMEKQQAYLEEVSRMTGPDPVSILAGAGVSLNLLNSGESIAELGFLYPELIQPKRPADNMVLKHS